MRKIVKKGPGVWRGKEKVKRTTLKKGRTYDTEKRHEQYIAEKQKAKKPSTEESRLKNFENEKQYGPIFTCMCCLRDGFKRSVKKITDNYMLFLHGSTMIRFLQISNDFDENDLDNRLKESLKVFGHFYLCKTCCKSLDKLEMPQCVQKIAWNIPQFLPVCKYLILKDNWFAGIWHL